MEEEIKDKLKEALGINNNSESFQGTHHYEDVYIVDIYLDNETEEFTVHFFHLLKTLTEDECGTDLGAWDDKTEDTPMTAKMDINLNVLSIA